MDTGAFNRDKGKYILQMIRPLVRRIWQAKPKSQRSGQSNLLNSSKGYGQEHRQTVHEMPQAWQPWPRHSRLQARRLQHEAGQQYGGTTNSTTTTRGGNKTCSVTSTGANAATNTSTTSTFRGTLASPVPHRQLRVSPWLGVYV